MPKLEKNIMVRLYGVSEKMGKKGLYKLVPFKNEPFNKEINESEIKDTLTNLTKALYPSDEVSFGERRWFQVCPEYDDTNENEPFCIEFDVYKRLEIRDITDLIDVDSGIFQYFILVNETHTEYQWVVVSTHIVYSDKDLASGKDLSNADADLIPFS